MKKILFLMLMTFVIVSCNSKYDDDKKINGNQLSPEAFVGSWYEETQNKEDSYSSSGLFYSKFCNTINQGELNGRYFVDSDNNRLIWTYDVEGTSLTSNWIITDVTDFGFTMSSGNSTFTYGKIIETFKMEGGDTKKITFDKETICGYENNSNIVTVSADGILTATGEKGTAYIKVKLTDRNVWVKIVVGDDVPDLWIDYSNILNCDFTTIKDTLGVPNKSQDFGDQTSYTYITSSHNILDYIDVSVNNASRFIKQIDLHVKDGVAKEKIQAYMNSHYYKIDGDYGQQCRYSTSSTLDDSRTVYVYDTENNSIMLLPAEIYEEQNNTSPLPKFSRFYGLDKERANVIAERKGWKYYDQFDVYSENGSVAYTFEGYNYTNAIELVYNTENVVSQCVVYMSNETPDVLILSYFEDNNYVEAEDEQTLRKHVYYNLENKMKVEFDILTKALYFTDLTQKPFMLVLLGTYWKGMGMSNQQVVDNFGIPYDSGSIEDADYIYYLIYSDYIRDVTYYLDKTNGKAIQINMQLQSAVNDDEVIAYLNRIYYFSEKEETAQGPRMRWYNAENKENATLRITYYPDYNMVVYSIPE